MSFSTLLLALLVVMPFTFRLTRSWSFLSSAVFHFFTLVDFGGIVEL
jgi:hypothetical protein